MTEKEFRVMVDSMHHSGLSDDQIMGILIESFEQKKCDIDDLEIMVSWLGYSLMDDFYKDHGIKRNK